MKLQLLTGVHLSVYTTENDSCLVQLTSTNHSLPRSVVVKEIRTTKSNEIRCFVMDEKVDVSQPISSSEELLNFAAGFFAPVSCFGVPFDGLLDNVKTIYKGCKNKLNRWQSNLCQKYLEKAEWSCCLSCNKLRKSLTVKAFRCVRYRCFIILRNN